MDPLGVASLSAAVLFSAATAVRPTSRLNPNTVLVAWWAALGVLLLRFVQLDFRLDAVATYSRAELSAPLRIAGAWAGPNGSLLLWWVFAATAASWASTRWVRGIAAVQCAGALTILFWANPFTTTTPAPINGGGLSPVLEHPAMLIHPPLLYCAHAAVIGAALTAHRSTSRRAINTAAALLLAATLLGAWWAHDELGWGGWWAWDPVENTALGPLLGLIAASHASDQHARQRWVGISLVATLAGVAATRSGLASSVHTFAPSPGPSVLFGVLAAIALVTLAIRPNQRAHRRGSAPSGITALAAAWTILVVASGEIAAMWLGTRTPAGTINGALLGRLILPVGILLAGGIVTLGVARNRNIASFLAHVGLLVFVAGVVASTADWSEGAVMTIDSRSVVHGQSITIGRPVVTDERADLVRAEVKVVVDGRELHPALLRYPDLDRTRSRPDRVSDWRGETEVAVTYLDDERARIEVRRHAGLGQVWGGGLMMISGLAIAAVRSSGAHPSRRRRFASSKESSEEAGSDDGSDGLDSNGPDSNGAAPEAVAP